MTSALSWLIDDSILEVVTRSSSSDLVAAPTTVCATGNVLLLSRSWPDWMAVVNKKMVNIGIKVKCISSKINSTMASRVLIKSVLELVMCLCTSCTLTVAADSRINAHYSGSSRIIIHTATGIGLLVRTLGPVLRFHWLSSGWWLLIGRDCSSLWASVRFGRSFWFHVLYRRAFIAASKTSTFSAAVMLAMQTNAGTVLFCKHAWRFFAILINSGLRHMELEKHLQRLTFESAPFSRVAEHLIRG